MNTVRIGGHGYYDARALVPSPGYTRRTLSRITQAIIHHSDTTYTGDDEAAIRQIHAYHKGLAWPGIAYHFLVAPTGVGYLTGDLDTVRNHSGGQNNVSGVAICLIGRYEHDDPPASHVQAARTVVRDLEQELGRTLRVNGHRDVFNTACPGSWWETWGAAYFREASDMTSEQREQLNLIAARIQAWADWCRQRGYVPGDTEPVDLVAARQATEFSDLATNVREIAQS